MFTGPQFAKWSGFGAKSRTVLRRADRAVERCLLRSLEGEGFCQVLLGRFATLGPHLDASILPVPSGMMQMKTECTHCGGHLEFEPDDRGLELTCPHCGESTMLVEGLHRVHAQPAPGTSGPPGGVFVKLAATTVVALVVLLVGFIMGSHVRRESAPELAPVRSQSVSNFLEVVDVNRTSFSGLDCVEGVVVNHATNMIDQVRVFVNFYDSHTNLVENGSDAIANVLPGDRWKFRCSSRSGFASYRLVGVRAD